MEDFIENTDKPTQCLVCNKGLAGRLGKKFCSDQCRALYHNRKKGKEERWIHQLNRILRKNRTVLKTLNPKGQSKVRQELMVGLGFDFRFYTHQFKAKNGALYYFCYEWGYLVLPEEKVLIVNWQEYMKPSSALATSKNL